jgi:glycosyltransferase involved in cell wall biosynthesis
MRVLILNQTFHPDVAATAQHMWDLARHLDAAGHDVDAVASRIVYGGEDQFERTSERIGRIRIHRVAQTAFGRRHGLAGRVWDFASFYVAALAKLNALRAPDVILALTSPPMISALGMLQKQFRGAGGRRPRLVYHVMDVYPQAAFAMGVIDPASLLARVTARLTQRTLELSDAVIVLGQDMKSRVLADYGPRHGRRIHVVHPWADGRELTPLDRAANPLARELGLDGTFNILYSGNFGAAHDADTIADAVERMRDDPRTRFIFIGGGQRIAQIDQRARAAGWPHVRVIAYQPRSLLNQSLNLGDVHLISQLPQFSGIVVPSKLFGIMAVGRPAVAVGPDDAEVSRLVRESGCGVVVPNGLGGELVGALRRLREDPALRARLGAAGRRAFESRFDSTIACARIERILRDVVEAP